MESWPPLARIWNMFSRSHFTESLSQLQNCIPDNRNRFLISHKSDPEYWASVRSRQRVTTVTNKVKTKQTPRHPKMISTPVKVMWRNLWWGLGLTDSVGDVKIFLFFVRAELGWACCWRGGTGSPRESHSNKSIIYLHLAALTSHQHLHTFCQISQPSQHIPHIEEKKES